VWVRVAGYGGSALLVAAAVAVLLLPLLDDGKPGRTAGAQTTAGAPAARPGASGLPASPAAPTPRRSGGGADLGGRPGGQDDGGPPIPEQGGSAGVALCPRGAASYRAAPDGVDVVVRVSASGAVRAELSLTGGEPRSRQSTVKGGGQHTFHFTGVAPRLVQRVKVTTISVGVAMQTCYARPAA
jgi:hypothetical protein